MPQNPFFRRKSHVRSGNQWEKNVYLGICEYLQSVGRGGYVHHLTKPTINSKVSSPQIIDIIVDNANGLNFGIECKSSQKSSLRLSTAFRHNGQAGQFEEETEFLRDANRIGIVALVMREAGSPENSPRYGAYFIPWSVVSLILTREITTAVLDEYVAERLVYKLPTEDGTARLPKDSDIFCTLVKMEIKGREIARRFFC